MGEGVDAELEGFEAGREIFDAVELVSPGALGAFDVAVELGPLRRQDEEAQVALSAGVLELGPELRPAIDLDALDAEGDLGDELVEEGCGAARGYAAGDEGDGPLRHRVVSREVLDGLVGSDVDEEGIDLDEFARPDRLHALGQALGVALAHDAQAAWTGFATKHRHGRDCQESCVQGHSEAAGGGLWRSRRAHWTNCFRDVTPSRFSPRTVCSMS